jgi:hypothetical protein
LFIQQTQRQDLFQHISKVAALIEGFQSPYGLELLSTVHWVATREQADNPVKAIAAIQEWNKRKQHLMKPAHIEVAWHHLVDQGWIQASGQ